MYAVFDIESTRAWLSNVLFICERLFYLIGAEKSSCSWISNQLVSVSLFSRLSFLNISYNYTTGSIPFGIKNPKPASKLQLTPEPTLHPTYYLPSTYQTSSPSINYTRWNETDIYGLYKKQLYQFAIKFGTFVFESVAMDTKCNDFEYFIDGRLSLNATVNISSISFSKGTDNPDRYSNLSMSSSTSALCNEQNKVDLLVKALQNRINANASCNGHEWKVFKCSNKILTLCVDCQEEIECKICPSSPSRVSINPCISDKTCPIRSTGYSVIGFNITKEILYPKIDYPSRTILNISSNSVTFSQKISKEGIVHCTAMANGRKPLSNNDIKSNGVTIIVSQRSSLSVEVEIKDLIPDTYYNIYCYIDDRRYFWRK